MNPQLVAIFAQVLAEYARIEGMRAENQHREVKGEATAYVERDFELVSRRLDVLAADALSLVRQ